MAGECSASSRVDFVCRKQHIGTSAANFANRRYSRNGPPRSRRDGTRPTTAPIQKPSTEGFCHGAHQRTSSLDRAAAAAVLVVKKALSPGHGRQGEPALKPNHLNQSRPVPRSARKGYWRVISLCSCEPGGVSAPAHTGRAAIPAEICTTVPPAKSSTPILKRKPEFQVQWARGAYTSRLNSAMKRI